MEIQLTNTNQMLKLDKNKRYNLEHLSDEQIKEVEKTLSLLKDGFVVYEITKKKTLYFEEVVNDWNVSSDISYTCDALELFPNVADYKLKTSSFEELIKFNKEFSEILNQPGYIMTEKDESEVKIINPSDEVFNPQPHYDNSKGSLYKVGTERGWNPYLFDVVKRLERGGKKDPLKQEIQKSIDVLKIWLNEIEG